MHELVESKVVYYQVVAIYQSEYDKKCQSDISDGHIKVMQVICLFMVG